MNVEALRRRLVYIIAMVVLLIPIYMLGQPSVLKKDGTEDSPGGALAQLRAKYDLGQGDLGEIDPASESMRLATLGLRGVAVTVLWQKADYYKREQYWDRYSATLNQISKLEPHFVKVWDNLAWNLSYNISVEFDDYRYRYAWVKKGIDVLINGSKYNSRRTDLPFQLGFSFGNKFGVSDEKRQYRAMYRVDEDWHKLLLAKNFDVRVQEGLGPDNRPDSWLTGRLWFNRCYDMVKQGILPCKGPTNFYNQGPMWMLSFAQAIEAEGVLNEAAKKAWRDGGADWAEFGNRTIRSTFGEDLRMNQLREANDQVARNREEFMKLCGDKYKEMEDEKRASLTPEQVEALAVPDAERTSNQVLLAYQASAAIAVPLNFVADKMPEKDRFHAMELALKVKEAEEFVQHIDIYRNQTNYTYWETRAVAEQSDEAISARKSLYDAEKLLQSGKLEEAQQQYEASWKSWDALFNKFPSMMLDDADEVEKAIKTYRRKVLDGDLPADFVLKDFLEFREMFSMGQADPRIHQALAEWSTNPDRGAWFDRVRKARAIDEAAKAAAAAQSGGDQPPGPVEMPKTDASPKPDAPKPDAPKADMPKAEAPAATPKPDAPQPEAPKLEAAQATGDKGADSAARPDEGAPPAPAPK